jgi:hypothetical protein
VLLSLRSHNRQTIIYANDYTSPYYKAFSDGRIREEDLIRCLMQPEGQLSSDHANAFALEQQQMAAKPRVAAPAPLRQLASASIAPEPAVKRKQPQGGASEAAIQSLIEDFKVIGDEILGLVVDVVENSEKPVPLAYLADRAQKTLGHPKTIGTNWAGSGGFLNFLTQNLPETMRLSEKPPHFVYNPDRHRLREDVRPVVEEPTPVAVTPAPLRASQPPAAPLRQAEPAGNNGRLAELQRSITRIYEACQAPPLPPSEYQLLFTLIAAEVREKGFAPDRSADAVVTRAAAAGLKLAPKDVAFVINAVDEIDPWLEHTRSPSAVARAYRDYVLGRCSQVGVQLTDDEYQLIQVWFGASQWTAAGNSGGEQRQEQPTQPDLPRRYGQPDLGLPSPTTHGAIPVPNNFGFPEAERDPEPTVQQSGGLRYSFLKHG